MPVTIKTAAIMDCFLANHLELSANPWGFANLTLGTTDLDLYLGSTLFESHPRRRLSQPFKSHAVTFLLCILLTEYMYGFRLFPRINSDFFPETSLTIWFL
jgi:hypothetical protein